MGLVHHDPSSDVAQHRRLAGRRGIATDDLQPQVGIAVGEPKRGLEVNPWIDREPRQIDDPDRAAGKRRRERLDHVADPGRHLALAVLVVVVAQSRVGE